ncbi:MAG: ABC-F family ATP-binding cassette domain-containing protein [Muribaculaceae bacterium]|nr:ABC-F family ATP-binding cassette domain-containing protein [Muribaculaceae bacterium]
MANVLNIENLSKSYGDRMLFADINLGVEAGEKIGIVARNGTGKSTFLRILAGREDYDSGRITFAGSLRVAWLEQTPEFRPGATVLEAALEGDGPLAETVRRYIRALDHGTAAEQAAATQRMDAEHAWDYEDRLRQLLTRLGLTDMNAPVDKLSGGQRKRLALARVVMQEADLIILDEPTNHLDIPVIEWLEGYLRRARATLIMVTHDRYFLDRVCNRIVEIDNASFYSYNGNYDYFLRRRAERIEAMAAELARVRNTLRREQEWMSRQPQARAGKAKFRIDSFYDLKERSRVRLEEKNVSLDAKSSYIGSKIFEARDISKRFGDKVILDGFSYTFARGEHVGLIGANGVGKSTFIKMLQGLVAQDSGSWNVGETVRFGYYSQDGISFSADKKVIDAVTELAEDIALEGGEHVAPMQYLQRFLFSPADQQKYISTLSGGERCRLHLATVLMRRPNFLILDEPTNDLDIITLGILEEYLAGFKGCVIVISHDRFFLDTIADHLFVMEGEGVIKDFPGTYSEYREWADERDRLAAAEQASRHEKTAEKSRPRTERPARMSFKERKEFEALTERLEVLNAEKSALEEYFNAGGGDDILEKSARFEAVKEELDEAEMRWLELSEKQ